MLQDILDSLASPQIRHAALVHIPIALGALGVLPLIALALTRFKNRALSLVCVGWFLAASGGAGLAAGAGEEAEEVAELRGLTPEQSAALHEHEELGEGGWMWPLIPAALAAATLLPRRKLAVIGGTLAIPAALGVAAWVTMAGHTGGTLVYRHGVGIPATFGAAAAPAAPPAATSPARDVEARENESRERSQR